MPRGKRPSLPPTLPCGCLSTFRGSANIHKLIVRSDGVRICSCGRRWKVAWEEVGEDLPKDPSQGGP